MTENYHLKSVQHRTTLNMATGSGKTYTALKGLDYVQEAKIIIVVVPSIDLANQWEKEID